MRCYFHRENESVGVCASCFRGICERCAKGDEKLLCKLCYEKISIPVMPIQPPKEVKIREEKIPPVVLPIPQPEVKEVPSKRTQPLSLIRDALSPIIIGGIVMGMVMGVTPLYLCFFGAGLGGMVSIYLTKLTSSNVVVSQKDAIRVGLFSGVVGAVVAFLTLLISNIVIISLDGIKIIGEAIGMEIAIFLFSLNIYNLIIKLIFMLIIFPIFSALGAVMVNKYYHPN